AGALFRGGPLPGGLAAGAGRRAPGPGAFSDSPLWPRQASDAGAGHDHPGCRRGAHAHPGQRGRVRASGAGQADNGDLAHLAIDAHPATAWHTDWYTSAHFGNLYPGTGLLVDMGRPVTITAARITLGNGHGAGLELRVGAAPALAGLPPAAHVADAGGVVRLRLPTPAHGRYVLIWFTSLPPGPAGTFQARVYGLQLEGRA